MTDYILFIKHYHTEDLEILDGCYFRGMIGIYDEYINPHFEEKAKSKGAMRELHKLFLNNLYGQEATSPDSSYKVPELDADDTIHYRSIEEYEKKPGYIPCGSMITAYARFFTLSAAQKNYDIFCYCDTDSIHCTNKHMPVGIQIDSKALLCWKHESEWNHGKFLRAKTYIEHITADGDEVLDEPYWNIKCAGMPQRCKDYFLNFYRIEDFKIGLKVPGKLCPVRIPGGVLLSETTFEIR